MPNGIEGDISDGFLVTGSGVHVELAALSEGLGLVPLVKMKQVIGALVGTLRNSELPPGFGPQFEEAKTQDGFIVTRSTFPSASRPKLT